jgi:hypothetical protein
MTISNIVFEYGDFENDIEILLIEKEVIFRLHLHNNLQMIKWLKVEIRDFARTFDSLSG